MVSYSLQPSGSIRLFVTINKERHWPTLKFKCKPSNWVGQRVTGKNSKPTNMELDRIAQEIEDWATHNPTNLYNYDQVAEVIEKIILNNDHVEMRKSISEYFEDFKTEKSTEINPRTNKRVKAGTIQSYQTAFDWFKEFGILELEQITKQNYNKFLAFLLDRHAPNTAGKYVKRMKSFFTWCSKSGLPINKGFEFWTPISGDSEEEVEERALNSEQLNRLYELVVDPIEVYQLAKKLHNKVLDPNQVDLLTASIDEARKQAIAMASIGPHKESFWKLTSKNIHGNIIRYKRNKNGSACIAPFRDNHIWHAVEFANQSGGPLFKRLTNINYYLTYVKELCNIPFHITAKTFRKTFGSIIWYELDHPNKMGIIMEAYGHKSDKETRRYLGIQGEDLERDHEELFTPKGF